MHRSDSPRVVQANAFGLRSPCGANAGVAVTVTLISACARTGADLTLHFFVQCDGDVFRRDVQDLAVSETLAGLHALSAAGPFRVVTTFRPPNPAQQT